MKLKEQQKIDLEQAVTNLVNGDGSFRDIVEVVESFDNWVSVEDGLPAPNTNVSVWCDSHIKVGWYSHIFSEWNVFGEHLIPIVTHWQPLPSPPKIK